MKIKEIIKKISPKDLSILKKLNSPIKIQNFLDKMPINHEKNGETYMSALSSLKFNKAHCLEGALIAALALFIHKKEPLILDLKTKKPDIDHVVAVYKINGYFGAISKTNHATLRFRDPIYKTIRELALSYFHEYFLNKNGEKTLISYSKPYNLKKYGEKWIFSKDNLWDLPDILDQLPHQSIIPNKNKKYIRKADAMERQAGEIIEWKINNPKT